MQHQKSQNLTYFILSTYNSLLSIKQPLRICTQFYNKQLSQIQFPQFTNSTLYQNLLSNQFNNNKSDIRKDMNRSIVKQNKIMEMYVYTQNDVYYSQIGITNLNRELNWNYKLLDSMKKSLCGVKNNAIVQFQIGTGKLKYSLQFNQNSIRILLFQIQLINLHKNSFIYAQTLLNTIHIKNTQKLQKLKYTKKLYEQNIEKIQILHKQCNQQHQLQMNLIKDKFVNVVNQVKKKLRPHFGIQEKKIQVDQSDTQTRTLFRIKNLEKVENRYGGRQSDNLLNLFD